MDSGKANSLLGFIGSPLCWSGCPRPWGATLPLIKHFREESIFQGHKNKLEHTVMHVNQKVQVTSPQKDSLSKSPVNQALLAEGWDVLSFPAGSPGHGGAWLLHPLQASVFPFIKTELTPCFSIDVPEV